MTRHVSVLVAGLVLVSSPVHAAGASAGPIDQTAAGAGSEGQTVVALTYGTRRGTVRIGLAGTEQMPGASGEARIDVQRGFTRIRATLENLREPSIFGHEYLTYILWAVSPDGRPINLGEVLPRHGRSSLTVTTPLQTFALIVTAEPYYAVRLPSTLVVMENIIRDDTTGVPPPTVVEYDRIPSGGYEPTGFRFDPILLRSNLPHEFFQARNALRIAQAAGAEQHAASTYTVAMERMMDAERLAAPRRIDRRALTAASREATQRAEDAREMAQRQVDAERVDAERRAAEAREAEARAQAQADLERRQQAEAERLAAEQRREEADRLSREALAAAQEAQRLRDEAEQLRAQAERQQREAEEAAARNRAIAEDLDRRLQEVIRDREELRKTLLQQLNLILETRDTARGLVVNLSDITFATGQATLQAGAREQLARVAGILLGHPTLAVEVEGHTDSVGSDEFNQSLSERRADTVRNYLIQQGVPASSISAIGFGKTRPVATNDTAEGRQMNRRVELVVSGDVIGAAIR